jgi:hypothetical protein
MSLPRDEPHFAAPIRYIEENPVNAWLAKRPQDWAFSSASWERGHLARKKASADETSAVPDPVPGTVPGATPDA